MKNLFLQNKRVVLLFSLLLLSFSLVSADKVQVSANPNVGIDIFYPKYDTQQQNRGFTYSVILQNKSSSKIINNSDANCSFHLTNGNGSHILEHVKMIPETTNWEEYNLFVGQGNFSSIGQYTYKIHCMADDIAGVVSHGTQVTPGDENNNIAYVWLVIILAYGIAFVGLFSKNDIVMIFGGMTMTVVGLYMLNSGIFIYRDTLTLALSYITIFMGAFFALAGAVNLNG